MPRTRPIRFGAGLSRITDRARLQAAAQRAEAIGYSTFGMADHFMIPLAPLIAAQAVADATTTLRVTQIFLAQDLRHPTVLAKELATLDVLSEGRLEVGIGAGWMRSEFEQAGIPFDSAPVRIERLEETVTVLKGLFADEPFTYAGRHFTVTGLDGLPKPVQRPHPPIAIGGGGPKLLAAAARHADIIQLLSGPIRGIGALDASSLTGRAYADKVDLIRDAAGARFDDIELAALLVHLSITDDVDHAFEELAARFASTPETVVPTREEILAAPAVAIGSVDSICEQLLAARDTYGISYFASPVGVSQEVLAPVIERLAGA